MRLLLFCGARQWGGAEMVLAHLVSGLSADVHATLLGVDAGVLDRIAARRPGTPVRTVPVIERGRDLRAINAHRRAIAAARPDIVQLNLPVPFAEPYSVLAALMVASKVVAVEHLPMPIPSRRLRALTRLSARRLAAHVAVGTATAREIETMKGRPGGTIRVVHNGIPAVPEVRQSFRPAGADFVVGGIGRLHRQKGFDVLVRAMVRVPGAHLLLVGDGPEKDALRSLAERLGVANRLTVTGWTDRPTDFLSAMDVVAMPSRFEGLPLVLLEAMATSRPVVGTHVGSIGDALHHERTGLVVPTDDDVALAAALQRLRHDGALRERLGSAASALARERFTLARMVTAYESLYEDLLRPHSTGTVHR